MIYVVLGIAALALGVAAGALALAVLARAEAKTARGELSRHRQSHADRVEERRAVRHGPPPTGPSTEQLQQVDLPTTEARAVTPGRRLPRPGELGTPR